MFSIRTDLAIEAHEMLTESTSDIQGVACDTSRHNNIAVTRVTVSTEEAAKALGKPVGRYITLEFNELNLADAEYHAYICKQLANELNGLLPKKEKQLILVVGLGNHNITPDALGPLVVSKVLVTRHLMHQPPFTAEKGIGPVSAIAPGVLGLTGMETAEYARDHADAGTCPLSLPLVFRLLLIGRKRAEALLYCLAYRQCNARSLPKLPVYQRQRRCFEKDGRF